MSQPPLRNRTQLHLPFSGEWLCFWGGDTAQRNYHRQYDAPDQRFAFDFVRIGSSDSFYEDDNPANDQSYSFGQAIMSPGRGMVIDVMDELPDNQPGEIDETVRAIGNYILIRHSEDEYSVLAHLQQGSALVGIAQPVKAGEIIAACGNSGQSTDPHLHYHLQDSARLHHYGDDSRAVPAIGIKPYFTDLLHTRSGRVRKVRSCSPVKGDAVESVALSSSRAQLTG